MGREGPRVAIDVGPLHGPRTGVGNAVAWTLDALAGEDLTTLPYVTSMRASVRPPERRLPIPAAVALRMWARPVPDSVRRLHHRWLGRPDVVHGTNYVAPPVPVPTLVSVYDCWFLANPAETNRDVGLAAAALRRVVADGAHVVTSSDASAARAGELLATTRVTAVALGPPPPPPDPVPDDAVGALEHEPFVLAIGSVERRKNLATLVAAFGQLAAEHDSVRLVIAGAPADDTTAVDRAIASLAPSIRARVMVTGPVTDGRKTWLLRAATTLAYPSLDEGFGFPILEAQQVGTPVVGSTAGSIPEVAGDAALLGAPTDVDTLAANLHAAVTDDDERAALIARGRANVARFSWTRTAAELAALYGRLADSAG